MGDLHSWPNGESTQSTLLQPYPPNPDPRDIAAATWHQAEEAAREVVRHVHPTVSSERRRKEVVSFVQKVLRQFAGAEVCAFGSVPLKTYLPDGDIDLTAIGLGSNFEDNLPNEVKNVLDLEEKKNNNSENKFEVKDVQLIHAEVKLVKCLVQNIIVDISFNQIGGLYTLCFLEQVDQLIGKDHLFKRSIMLIKSWCYYESRILGAHHGLISTYALETLVLYIFHLFHKSLHAPLSVLYRFLDYYSKFDWENYGVSLCGPISLASLPDIIPEQPEIATSELLIQEDFLRQCVDRFQVPARPNEIRSFAPKFLNIVDPLKYGNNLGRSVSKGNFYRIRSAFVFGARKLGQILTSSSSADVSADVSTFFRNTLERHGSGLPRPDITPLQDELRALPDANGNIPSEENLPEPSRTTTPTQTSIYHAPHMFFHNNNHNHNNYNNNNNDNNTSNNNNDDDDDDNGLSDLNGEMDINTRNLLYAQQCHEYSSMGAYMMPLPGPLPGAIPLTGAIPIYRGKPPGPYPVRIPRGYFGPGPGPYYVMNGMPPAGVPGSPGGGYGGEESPKPRGTGTYFPMNNYRPQGYNRDREQSYRDNRERVSPRARNPVSRSNSNTGRSPDPLPVDDSSSSSFIPASDMQQQQQQQLAVSNQVVTPVVVPFVTNRWVPMQQQGGGSGGGSNNNGVGPRQVEFGSLGSVVLPPVVVANQGAPAGATTRPVLGPNQRRRNSQMYQLKDEGDFPPLSG